VLRQLNVLLPRKELEEEKEQRPSIISTFWDLVTKIWSLCHLELCWEGTLNLQQYFLVNSQLRQSPSSLRSSANSSRLRDLIIEPRRPRAKTNDKDTIFACLSRTWTPVLYCSSRASHVKAGLVMIGSWAGPLEKLAMSIFFNGLKVEQIKKSLKQEFYFLFCWLGPVILD
jgi:hypothetical protein